MSLQLLPLVALAPLLFMVAFSDLREMRIPNRLVLIALGLFVLCAPLLGWSEIGARLTVAGVTLAIGYVLFTLRAFGGGDVKFLTVLMLFVPSAAVAQFLIVFSVSLIIGSGIAIGLQRAPVAARLDWMTCRRRGKLPMGISLAMAGLALPYVLAIG
ncbi:hypothetical protein BMI90_14100 [Thioclava sp. L04-15]|uniref:A24 family peptidase n=1 Tax=Thioclava sp. L04-15 TaxID=1915318 RepID=UPI000997CC17|nr:MULTISPECIES: prepilin peptidase [unclassified Thioclava]MBD3802347.1 prepilin peptidase [Thioclava sp.]OOY27224.1 hypothetical protein BMI90_14100 [Thioclava sp. L04-15]TNE93352.1 MAG: hypothetical protein EP337_03725 [Paracoccaceae bacterium]